MNQLLETPRLRLRHFVSSDRDSLHSILGDAEVMQFSIRGVHNQKQIREFIDRQLLSYLAPGFGLYAIIHKQNDESIGYCGLLQQSVDGKKEIEIGYRLAKKYWGQGLATEAATAIAKYGREKFGFQRLICIIDPANKRSIRVAEKIGMKFESDTIYRGVSVRIYLSTLD